MTDQSSNHGVDESESQSPAAEIWTSQKVLNWSAKWLKEKSESSSGQAKLEAELLLTHVLKINRMQLFLQLDRPLNKTEREEFKLLLRRRADGEPIAYILGYRDFYRHRFIVSKDVLIPRPDTELLVEQASLYAKGLVYPKILDVGTGSGCIALSLASELPHAKVLGFEVSPQALAITIKNQEALKIENANFQLKDGLDIYSYSSVVQDGELFDMIVSNPPYIPVHEISCMSQETLKYEPKQALFSGDDEGVSFYKFFAENCRQFLKPHGKIFLEFGFSQGSQLVQLFEFAGWKNIKILKDLSAHDRLLIADRN